MSADRIEHGACGIRGEGGQRRSEACGDGSRLAVGEGEQAEFAGQGRREEEVGRVGAGGDTVETGGQWKGRGRGRAVGWVDLPEEIFFRIGGPEKRVGGGGSEGGDGEGFDDGGVVGRVEKGGGRGRDGEELAVEALHDLFVECRMDVDGINDNDAAEGGEEAGEEPAGERKAGWSRAHASGAWARRAMPNSGNVSMQRRMTAVGRKIAAQRSAAV